MSTSIKQGAPMPKSLGACADEYHEVRELRLAMQKEVDAVAARERELMHHLLENLSASSDTGVAGQRYRAQIRTSEAYTVVDYDDLYDYIAENDRFDLLAKKISTTAVKEMYGKGVRVPGTQPIQVKKVSVTKI